jgi:2'-5' RNA ligase
LNPFVGQLIVEGITMIQTIRTFIAVELEQAQHRALEQLQARLKRERASSVVRWVAPDNIHLTVKFLGDVDPAMMPALNQSLGGVCAAAAPFELRLAGAGAFPNTRRPNVIWVGIDGAVAQATELADKIDQACHALGFSLEERPFSPHLTLGRVKREASPDERLGLGELIANAKVDEAAPIRVERVSVMKSELRPAGSVYSRLYAGELGGR